MLDPSRLQDPGYTPSRSEIPEVLEALVTCDDEQAAPIERALGRAGIAAAEQAVSLLATAVPTARVRLVRLVARVARESESPGLFDALCARLDDPEAIVQRAV